MNTTRVKVTVSDPSQEGTVVIPVATPPLAAVRALAERLHRAGQPFEAVIWGWTVNYEPEIDEAETEFEVPDGFGGLRTELRRFWSPASFTIGESGVWFYSLLWENGGDKEPVAFLDDRNIAG